MKTGIETQVFIARQPVLDRRGAVVGQELLFRDAISETANVYDGFACSAAVVERVVGTFGLDQILENGDGFLNCTGDFLASGLVDVLPPSRFVLEVLEDIELTPALGARCDVLRRSGFRIALDDVRTITPAVSQFLPHVDIVKLDWPYIAADLAKGIVAGCKNAGKLVLAEKVEERTLYAAALAAGCDLFQGFYFSKPEVLATEKMPSSIGPVLRVLQLLADDASSARVEQALKDAPILVVQLLRLASSASHPGSRHSPVTSIGRALVSVGTRQLMRWCCLILYGYSQTVSVDNDPLVRLVERRARLMEQTAAIMRPHDEVFCAAAWLTGMLSLVHVAHRVRPEALINQLPIDETIRQAIIGYDGDLGALLCIADKVEKGHFQAAFSRASAIDLDFSSKLRELMCKQAALR